MEIPPVPTNLLEALDGIFPDQCPRIEDDERLVWFKSGQRAVVDFLKEQHKRQNETILGTQ